VATNLATSCTRTMSGTATVAVNTLPAAYSLTGGGNYCDGGTGVHVGLSGSSIGISYQLFRNGVITGVPAAGTGGPIDFGLQTAPGLYTAVANNLLTGCPKNMTGSTVVGVNTAPSAFSVTGGGQYCAGSDGVTVGLSGSVSGINYQLYKGGIATLITLPGSGASLDFGLQTDAGSYSVIATNATSHCISNMSGAASIVVNPLPATYTVTGGGTYCEGGGGVTVGLNSSGAGVNYQLYNAAAPTGINMTGTAAALNFGLQTAAGSYTVLATNFVTGCSSMMSDSAIVHINLPVAPSVTLTSASGTSVCAGHLVTLTALAGNGGATPVFEWRKNGLVAPSTGSNYTFLPTDGDNVTVNLTSSANCASPVFAVGSATMTVGANASPEIEIYATPGNVVCKGTTVTYATLVTYGGTSPTYSWILNGNNVSNAPTYSFVPANDDKLYCILQSNYACRLANSGRSNDIKMEVDDNVAPVVSIDAYPNLSIAKGELLTLTAQVTSGGPNPTYRWNVNGVSVAGATSASYTSGSFSNLDNVTCEVVSGGGCPGLDGAGSATINVSNVSVKQIAGSADNILLVPNPNKGTFTIKGAIRNAPVNEDGSIEVVNMLGEAVYRGAISMKSGNINEKIVLREDLPNGMYLVILKTASFNDLFHIVIEK